LQHGLNQISRQVHIWPASGRHHVWWPQDRPNGVMAFERTDGSERIVTVVNAGRSSFQARQTLGSSVVS